MDELRILCIKLLPYSPEIEGVSVNVMQSLLLLHLDRFLEEAHGLCPCNIYSEHAIRVVRTYPAVQCDEL